MTFNQRVVHLQRDLHSIVLHVVGIHGHKGDVDNGGEGDEEFAERVEDEVGEEFCASDPEPTAVADAEDVAGPLAALDEDVFYCWAFVIVVVLQFGFI